MKNQFDTLLENQKEMMDFWKKASRNTLDAFTQQSTNGSNGKGSLDSWYKKQRSFFEDALQITDPKEAWEKAPEQYKKWFELQQELATHSMEMLKGGENPMQAFAKAWNPEVGSFASPAYWNKQLTDSAQWVQKNLLGKMPFAMGGHLTNFTQSYEEFSRYWEPIKKMIQFGLFDEKSLQQFFPADALQDFMGNFLGFQPIKNLDQTIDQMRSMFEQYMENFRNYGSNLNPLQENWSKYFENGGAEGLNPLFKIILDVNRMIKDTSGSMLHLSNQTKEIDIARILGEIQFAYVAFLIKTNALQTKVLESGKDALPETLKEYYKEYKESKEMPAYPDFYNRLINNLEHKMLEVLESDSYSLMQSEVAQLGVQVKAHLDDLVEVAVGDLPFLTNSHADEIARELHQMRSKIRTLEAQVKELSTEKKKRKA